MDGRSRRHAEHVKSEVRCSSTLVEVVVRRAVVARVVVRTSRTSKVAGECRRRVRTRDHHHAGLRNERRSSRSRTRTGRTDNAYDILVGNDHLGRSLTTISATEVIKTGADRDVMATNGPVVTNSELDTTLVRNTKERHITGNGVQRTNLDLLTGTNLNSPKRTITKMVLDRRHSLRGRSSSRRRSRSRSRRSSSRSCSRRSRSSSGSRSRTATSGGIPAIIGATGAGDHRDRQSQGQQNTSVATHGPLQGVDESNTAKRPPKRTWRRSLSCRYGTVLSRCRQGPDRMVCTGRFAQVVWG